MPSTEREALEDGLSSEFWKLLSDYVTKEWGPSGLRYQSAVIEASKQPDAVVELRKVLAAQEAILQVMRWPAERVNQLKTKPLTYTDQQSRRGIGL